MRSIPSPRTGSVEGGRDDQGSEEDISERRRAREELCERSGVGGRAIRPPRASADQAREASKGSNRREDAAALDTRDGKGMALAREEGEDAGPQHECRPST